MMVSYYIGLAKMKSRKSNFQIKNKKNRLPGKLCPWPWRAFNANATRDQRDGEKVSIISHNYPGKLTTIGQFMV